MPQDPNTYFSEKIHRITLREGVFSGLLSIIMAGAGLNRIRRVAKLANQDPEFKAALIDYAKQQQRIEGLIKTICDRDPDLPNCKKRDRRQYHRK
jgi:hypothetical protein